MNEQEIIKEAQRCLNCKNPKCKEACPLRVDIPQMIDHVKRAEFEEAYRIDYESNPLGIICGLICPHERQCQGSCVRGIKEKPVAIGAIEHYVCSVSNSVPKTYKSELHTNSKVAIIGGGPAGISCAHELSKENIKSTIFEKESFLGGILMYGIPDFRLDKKLVVESIDKILDENIEIKFGMEYNEKSDKLNIAKLKEDGYEYIFISTGLDSNKKLDIPGTNSNRVLYANDYLRDYYKKENNISKNSKVAVIGGGNVAIDTARVARKLGNDVTIIYRKTREKMPANNEEVESSIEEGVKFIFETNVIRVEEQDGLKLYLDNNEEYLVDYLIIAIGSTTNEEIMKNVLINKETGLIFINENLETKEKNVFAGGDIINNKGTVASAINDGIRVAKYIIEDEKHKKTT